MTKKKYIIIFITILAVCLGVVGWLWRAHSQKQAQLARRKSAKKSQTLSAVDGSNSISLNNTEPSGLSVDQNTSAASLGQLGADSNEQAGSSGSSSKKSTSSSPFDPTTFAQYEKYKDSTTGLFAEVQVGTGAELTANKRAAVYYKGWLTNGQLFDESRSNEKGQLQPFVFTLGANEVIPGWEQALAGMKVGGVRLVIVSPGLGYGVTGHGPVPGNAVLIFQVQLAAVE